MKFNNWFWRISFFIGAIGLIIWGIIELVEYYEYLNLEMRDAYEKPRNQPILGIIRISLAVILLIIDFWPSIKRHFAKK